MTAEQTLYLLCEPYYSCRPKGLILKNQGHRSLPCPCPCGNQGLPSPPQTVDLGAGRMLNCCWLQAVISQAGDGLGSCSKERPDVLAGHRTASLDKCAQD